VRNNSGFGWDTEKQVPTAPDQVWDAYLQAHPQAKAYRHCTLPMYEELDELCASNVATGEYALTGTDLHRILSPTPPPEPPPTQTSPVDPNLGSPTPPAPARQSSPPPTSSGTSQANTQRSGRRQRASTDEASGNDASTSQAPQRRKRVRKSVGQSMTSAMERIGVDIAGSTEPGRNVSERASKKLQEEYGESMEDGDLYQAMLLLENDVKAAMFLSLEEGPFRDYWLDEEISRRTKGA
jgi:hypothetical protein